MLENQTDKIKRKDKNPFWKGQIYEKLPENEYFFHTWTPVQDIRG